MQAPSTEDRLFWLLATLAFFIVPLALRFRRLADALRTGTIRKTPSVGATVYRRTDPNRFWRLFAWRAIGRGFGLLVLSSLAFQLADWLFDR
jgi:hypothetical protein